MPYLQLDLSAPPAGKRALAAAPARAYSTVMEADEQRISVSFRELGRATGWEIFRDGRVSADWTPPSP